MTKNTQNRADEIDFFDRFTLDKEYDVFTPYGYNTIFRHFQKFTADRLSSGHRVADLGCGTGAFTELFFKDADSEIYGIDISPNSIALAKQKTQKVNYIAGDITALDFEDNFFDLIVYSGVLHHFQDFESCLKEGWRVLKKGGVALSYDPHLYNPCMWLYRHPSSPFFSDLGKTENEQLFSAKIVEPILKKIGFQKIEIFGISGVTFKYVESRIGRILLPVYNLLEKFLGLTPLEKKIGSFLICSAQKP